MKRSGPIKRKSCTGEKIGKHTGKIRLYGPELIELRRAVFDRSCPIGEGYGICELRYPGVCERWASWSRGEMHHKVHRSLGGSDTLENCVWACPSCHRKAHNQ
jgi:hypothetical protein